jgi:prepilin-type N-terminal cleavage/methylation domain-containing protein
MRERGYSLIEMTLAVAVILVLLAIVAPNLRAASAEAHIKGAVDVFQGEFLKARSIAVRSNVQTAIRFERAPSGMYLSTYQDGNHNGVLAADIREGVDRRIAGPRRLSTGAIDVEVAIRPGLPAPPPERGRLDPRDPIRFGRGEMLSFSPLGTATPGTFYLMGAGVQAAVRVNPQSARVRTLFFRRDGWREQ